MEPAWTIWTQDVPRAVVSALAEQWDGAVRFADDAADADVFLTGAGGRDTAELRRNCPAVPSLEVSFDRPLRLGLLMRQIGNVVSDPVLWLESVALGGYTLYPPEKIMTGAAGGDIHLTDKEVEILVFLARHHRRAVGRDELLRHVWRYQQGVDTHTLETHIYRLRQKIGDTTENPHRLLTVEGGYRLNLQEAEKTA